jgi:broad specificity phosphatase PhoE
MTKLYFIKHARPDIQALIPANGWHLSESGRQDCQSIINQLADQEFKRIFSSSEPKAVETAEIIASGLSLPFEIQPGLHEHDRSNTPYFKSKTDFENQVKDFFNNPASLVMGKETALQVFLRFKQAIDQVIVTNAHQNIAVVSHGTVITLLVSYYNRIEPFNFWHSLALPSITVLQLPDFNLIPDDAEQAGTKI